MESSTGECMKYVAPFLIGLSILISNLIVWKIGDKAGYDRGLNEGVDMYHQLCYNSSDGRIMMAPDNTVVYCYPLTKLLEKELDKQSGT
jgi:hypothetical protein